MTDLHMHRFKCALLVAVAALVAGCTQQNNLGMAPDFGVALRQDLAAQIADPDPHYVSDAIPHSSGARAALAGRRYERNEVIQPVMSEATVQANGTMAPMAQQPSAPNTLPLNQ